MNILSSRSLYPGTRNKIFLDSACVGLAPSTAKESILSFMDLALSADAVDASAHHIKMDALKEEALHSVQKLFNAPLNQVCLIESTTHGLNIAANALDLKEQDEVIICDTEYLQVAIPFVKLAEKNKCRIVPLRAPLDSVISTEQFEQLINKHTKVICVSAVQWSTGQRVFNKALGELCLARDIWLIVDGVQEAGALDIDVSQRYCDFYIAGGHKWLNSPYGCGILYMSKKALALEPSNFGYLNLEAPPLGWGNYFQDRAQTPFRSYNFPKSARTFSIGGTSNYPGAIGLKQAVDIVHAIGIKNVEQRVLGLAAYLKEQLKNMGLKVIGNGKKEEQSGITMFSIENDFDKDHALLHHLLKRRILISQRYTNGHGGLRVSTHFYNNEEDIDGLCEAIRSLLKHGSSMTKKPEATRAV